MRLGATTADPASRRRVNPRALAVVIVCALALGLGVYLLHGMQSRRHAGHFLAEARQANEEGRTKEAIGQYERYLDLVPEDPEAMAELGLLLADARPGRRAYELLERVLRQQPDRMDVRRKVAPLAVRLGRFNDAREHLVNHLLVASPEDNEWRELLARCQAGLGQYEVAAETLQSVLAAAPDRVECYPHLALLLAERLGKPDEATRWMDRLTEENPNSARAHLLRGGYLVSLGQTEGAEREAAKALELAPDDPEALALGARTALAGGDLEQARARARHGLEQAPGHVSLYGLLAEIELKARDPEKAAQWLRLGLEKGPGQEALLRALATVLVESGRSDEAQGVVDRLRAAGRSRPLAEYFQARIDYLRGQWRTAAECLERARPGLVRWPGLQRDAEYWLSKCHGRLGATEKQLAALGRAVALDRLWVPAHAEIVEVLLAANRLDEAVAEQRRLVELPGARAGSRVRLARLLLLENLRKAPDQRDWAPFDQALQAAAREDPQAAELKSLRAESLIARGRAAQAESLLREALAKTPGQAGPRILLAAMHQQRAQWERAEALLDEAEKKAGDSVAIRLARARYLVQRYRSKAAEALRPLAEGAEKMPAAQRGRLWRGLIAAQAQADDMEGAAELCRKAVQDQPDDLSLRLTLLELAFRTRNPAGMEEALEDIRRIEGEGPLWHYGQAVRLSAGPRADRQKALREALAHLGQAARLRPGWGRVPLLAGEVCELLGDRPGAVREYQRAVEQGEFSPRAVHRVVQSLYAAGRYEEADRLIRRLQTQQGASLSGEFGRVASELSMRLEDFDRALAVARKTAAGSKDYRDHMWLGQVLEILGRRAQAEGQTAQSQKMFADAEKALRQAVTLAEEVPQTWIALVGLLSRAGRAKEAEATIVQAEAKIPADRASLALARAYELVGKPREAAGKYAAALAAAPNDPAVVRQVSDFYLRADRVPEAEQQLERLACGEVRAPEPDVAWARRRLALALAARPDPQRYRRARALIEQNLRSPDPSVLDQRAKVMVLAADPDSSRRSEAIRTLEGLVADQRQVSPEDRLFLARLYLADGDWPKARDLLRGLAVSESREPRYLAAYVEALLNHSETAEAETWLRRLEQITPGDFLPVALRAKMAIQQEHDEQAVALWKTYLEGPDARPPDPGQRLRLAWAWLEHTARLLDDKEHHARAAELKNQAEQMLQHHAKSHPEGGLLLVRLLAREGRLEEATELVSKAVGTAKPADLAQMCAVLVAGTRSEQPARPVGEVLKAALAEHPQSIPLLMVMADLTTLEGRLDETEGSYRKVIEKDPRNVEALNNLAVLLALKQTRVDEALAMIQKAIEVAGPDSTLLDSRASVYLARREPDKALADLAAAIADRPRPTRFFHRAQAYHQTAQKELAAEALKEANRRGLTPEQLHPLERPAYQRLQSELQ